MKDALEILNPWWFGEKDNDLGKWEKQKVKWVPKWIEHISLKPFSLNFIVGPRQVGKTTGIKLLIKSLIEKGIEKEKIIYLNAELIPEIGKFEKTLISISRKNFDFIFI
ncbi:MAG: AAA family ATPase, partial [Thermoproteota archaeon]